eukprot:5537308-Amphidinium_carterae.1
MVSKSLLRGFLTLFGARRCWYKGRPQSPCRSLWFGWTCVLVSQGITSRKKWGNVVTEKQLPVDDFEVFKEGNVAKSSAASSDATRLFEEGQ